VALRSAQNGVYAVFVVFTFAFLSRKFQAAGIFLKSRRHHPHEQHIVAAHFLGPENAAISLSELAAVYELPQALTTISKIIALQIKRQLNID